MDEFDERRLRLLYRQNLTFSDVIDRERCSGEESMFKQQHNSKLNGKFAESCHEMGVPDFRYDAVERERDAATMVVEIHRGRRLRGSSTKAAAAVVVLDEAESRRFNADVCFGCRNLFVAGINMRVRIEYGRSKRKEKGQGQQQGERARTRHRRDRKKDRAVVYECLVCGVCAVFRHSLLSAGETASRRRSCAGHLPLNTLPALAPVPTPTPSATRQELGADAETAAQPGGRKKKKKKRKGGLSELLAQKRQREQDGDGDGDALLAALLT